MKVTTSEHKITPFGGFNFCFKLLRDIGIPKLIDTHLGNRVKYVGFDYSEIFMNHLAIFLNGGDATEDINDHLREHLLQVKGCRYAVPTPFFEVSRNCQLPLKKSPAPVESLMGSILIFILMIL